jgi:hypothetical protein
MASATKTFSIKPAGSAYQRDLVLLQPGQLTFVVPIAGHVVALCKGGIDIDLTGHRLGRTGHPPSRGDDIAGTDQRLAGYAAPIGAFTADELSLDERNAQPAVGTAPRDHLTGRASTDHDHIELLHHTLLSVWPSKALSFTAAERYAYRPHNFATAVRVTP